MTKTKTPKKPAKPFHRLTDAQKRVAIAKDAIKQIKLGAFKVYPSCYITLLHGLDEFRKGDSKELTKKTPCKVCQIGQGIISGIRLFNRVTAFDIMTDEESALDLITRWFSRRTAVLMEGAMMSHRCRNGEVRSWPGWLTRELLNNRDKITREEEDRLVSFQAKHRSHKA